jgi:arabinan endo-1,5-alpha-L-arabinosidase
VGSSKTRIWAQQLSFSNTSVTQVGSPVQIMDSTGVWWINSWVAGGSLVEGPEVVYTNGWYYLFFAAGEYCTDSYTEGVARSKSLFGPYEKMLSPVLNNGIAGVAVSPSSGEKHQLVGPGHASIVKMGDGTWRIVWHASIGENCDRYAFVTNLVFGSDGWPYVNL